jgi:hypothetical protein
MMRLQNAVYGRALADGMADAPSTAASAYHDSYVVEPAWAGDLSKLPPGVSRIVDGTRKLFEVWHASCRAGQQHPRLLSSSNGSPCSEGSSSSSSTATVRPGICSRIGCNRCTAC